MIFILLLYFLGLRGHDEYLSLKSATECPGRRQSMKIYRVHLKIGRDTLYQQFQGGIGVKNLSNKQ